eukprot:g4187.t1
MSLMSVLQGSALRSRAVRQLASTSWPAHACVSTTAIRTTFRRKPSFPPTVTAAPRPTPTTARQGSHGFASNASTTPTTITNINTNRAGRSPKLPACAHNGGSRRAASSSTTVGAGVSGPAVKRVLYDGHQPTSPLQRTAMAGWAAVTALMEPERADMVATLGEVTGRLALERLYRCMLADPEGREILRARPVINEATVDLAALAALPQGTFGKSYSNFMAGNKFSPDSRSAVQYVDDPDLAYVMRRYREVHDLWHVLSGLPPTVEGELALKWFELVQTGLPVCALGAVVGPLALPRREPTMPSPSGPAASPGTSSSKGSGSAGGRSRGGSREVLARTYVPWAIRAGRRARKPLVCVWYERRWEQPVEQVRRELGVEVAPRRGRAGEAPVVPH